MTHCERGDVVLVLFPDSNLRSSKRRPDLVVQADGLDSGLAQTIVAMITSNLDRAGHPARVMVRQETPLGQQMGLMTDSVVMADNLATVRHGTIEKVIGHCGDLSSVGAALRHTLAI